MESAGSGGELILNHALLQFLLEYSCVSSYNWLRFERQHVNRRTLLQGLASVTCTSKVSHVNARFALEFAALCLASFDVVALDLGPAMKAKFVLKAFDTNMAVFMKSRRLKFHISLKLRMVPLGELGAAELHQLRATLLSGWQVQIEVRKGDGQADLPNV